MCFSLEWIENVLIWLVVLAAIVAILRILIPWVFSFFGVDTGPLLPIINIVVWAIVAIFVIVIVFSLIACLLGGGFGLPSLHPRAGLLLYHFIA